MKKADAENLSLSALEEQDDLQTLKEDIGEVVIGKDKAPKVTEDKVKSGDVTTGEVVGNIEKKAVFLSESTGMIETPTPIEDATNALTVGEVKKGWKVKSLLQGDINPADIITIESKFVKGEFIIESVEHKGDTHSKEWSSEVICYGR